MSMIQADRLTFSYPGSPDPVFQEACFQIDTDWRLGLVGRNGRGKTTLLRLLMGEYPCEGALISSVPFDYFPCPVPDQERLTAEVLEDLCPEAESWRFPKELSLSGVEERLYGGPSPPSPTGSGRKSFWRPCSSGRGASPSSTSPPTTWTPTGGNWFPPTSGGSGALSWYPTTAASWTAVWTTSWP